MPWCFLIEPGPCSLWQFMGLNTRLCARVLVCVPSFSTDVEHGVRFRSRSSLGLLCNHTHFFRRSLLLWLSRVSVPFARHFLGNLWCLEFWVLHSPSQESILAVCGGALGSSVRAPGPRGHLLLDVTICFTGRVFLLEENEVQGENDRSCFFNLLGGSAVTRASSEHSDALFLAECVCPCHTFLQIFCT